MVLWLVEAGRFTAEDRTVASRLESVKVPVIAVINKIDQLADNRQLLPFMEKMNSQRDLKAAIPISALKGTGTDVLRDEIVPLLPESPAMFPDEMLTDRFDSFRIAEIVRVKLTRREDGKLEINTIIFVERDSQKGIVVGKGGQNLKLVGSSARRDIERMLGESVHLDLWVKVRDNWADSEQDLNRLGFDMGD